MRSHLSVALPRRPPSHPRQPRRRQQSCNNLLVATVPSPAPISVHTPPHCSPDNHGPAGIAGPCCVLAGKRIRSIYPFSQHKCVKVCSGLYEAWSKAAACTVSWSVNCWGIVGWLLPAHRVSLDRPTHRLLCQAQTGVRKETASWWKVGHRDRFLQVLKYWKNLLSFQASNTTYTPGKGKLSLPSLWFSTSAWRCKPVSKTPRGIHPTPDLQHPLPGCQAVRVILWCTCES